MGRIRTIKPEFWTNEDLASVSEAACLMAVALLNHCDDEGYFKAHHGLIRAACCPLRELSVSIHGVLTELSRIGFIELCEGKDGKPYGRVPKFALHQRVNRPSPSSIRPLWTDSGSTLPAANGFSEDSMNPHGGLTEDSLPERKGKEGKGKGRERKTSGQSPREADANVEVSEVGGVKGLWLRLPDSFKTPEMKEMLTAFDKHRRQLNIRPWTPSGCDAKVREWVKYPCAHVIASGYRCIERNYQGFIIDAYREAVPASANVPGAVSIEDDVERILRERAAVTA